MTRINVVPVSELCDEHLRAEHRELTRIPNAIAQGKLADHSKIPSEYVLGTGHVYFFADKLVWLLGRYIELRAEMRKRGFKIEWRWPKDVIGDDNASEYTPSQEALDLNRQRIKKRWPKNAHYYSKKVAA